MSLITSIKLADTTSTTAQPVVSFEDREAAEAVLITNMLGRNLTTSPKKNFPLGRAVLRTTKRRNRNGTLHINVNVKRTDQEGLVTRNEATNDLIIAAPKSVLKTLSISCSLPRILAGDPEAAERYKKALLADGDSIIQALATELDNLLVANA
jgi:hypothetical protein